MITFAGVCLRVTTADPESARIAAFVTADMPSDGAADEEVTIAFDARPDGSPGEAAVRLAEEIAFVLCDRARRGPVLHAALVGGVLVPGASGVGKSTLAAAALLAGARLGSDELVAIDGAEIAGLPRPLHLKAGSASPLTEAWASIASEAWPVRGGLFAPARAFGARVASAPEVARLVVLPRRGATPGAPRVSPVAPQVALRALMEVSVNARNLAGHGFASLASLVRRVPSVALDYTDVTTAWPTIAELLRGSRAP